MCFVFSQHVIYEGFFKFKQESCNIFQLSKGCFLCFVEYLWVPKEDPPTPLFLILYVWGACVFFSPEHFAYFKLVAGIWTSWLRLAQNVNFVNIQFY